MFDLYITKVAGLYQYAIASAVTGNVTKVVGGFETQDAAETAGIADLAARAK